MVGMICRAVAADETECRYVLHGRARFQGRPPYRAGSCTSVAVNALYHAERQPMLAGQPVRAGVAVRFNPRIVGNPETDGLASV